MSKGESKPSATMTLNAEKLKEILKSPTFKQKLMFAAYGMSSYFENGK
jgi:hypothetical protein